MWVEIINGVVGQQIDDFAAVTTAGGIQYPWNWPKTQIPNLVSVVMATPPDQTTTQITGYTIDYTNNIATQVFTTLPISISALQQTQILLLSTACGTTIESGFPVTISGIVNTITLTITDQTNALMAATSAQTALQEADWVVNTTYSPSGICILNGIVLVTFTGGVSGTTPPSPPAEFEVSVIDNTITWYKLGFWIGTTAGNIMVDPATTILCYKAGVVFVSQQRSKYTTLKAAIMVATTAAEIQAIVW